jgi:hypothetical protein
MDVAGILESASLLVPALPSTTIRPSGCTGMSVKRGWPHPGPSAALVAGSGPGCHTLTRSVAKGKHGRSVLADTDQVLIGVVYVRQICSQLVLLVALGQVPQPLAR